MQFPTLFKKTSTGAIQTWAIETEGSTIKTHWGQVGGAIQNTAETIKEGKNVGKANATTPVQQAEAEAKSTWELKLKKGYVENMAHAVSGKVDKIIEGGIFPMLAHTIEKRGKDLKYPAYVQPKLDGHRCIAICKNGKVTLWSRSRKPITGVPHIVYALENIGGLAGENFILDGELYNHDYRDNFEELTHFIRQKKPVVGHENVEYHIYDLPLQEDYKDRLLKLKNFFFNVPLPHLTPLRFVATIDVIDEKEMMFNYDNFVESGYEGAIVRNAKGFYKNKRSSDLLKVKRFQDAEFKVVDVIEGKGKLAGHGIFICATEKGDNNFKAKLAGELNSLKQYWTNPKLALGRMLTVQFQGYSRYGIPRFPVGLRFRKDI